MTEPLERQVVISGIGMSAIGRRLQQSELALTLDACLAAIDDARLSRADIGGLAVRPSGWTEVPGFSGPRADDIQDALRLELDWVASGPAGNGQLQGIVDGCGAITARSVRHVLVVRTVSESSPPPRLESVGVREPGRAGDNLQWLLPFGATSGINWLALYAQRHFHEYGTTREQLGQVAVNARRNAAFNPAAVYRSPLSLDEYLAARMISTPLCLFDCDVPVDGAVAFVLSHRDHVGDLPHPTVHINAVGTGLHGRPLWGQWDDMTTMAARDAARTLWRRTDLGPPDVDVAELYDGASILTLLWLEALGFCGKGEGGPFVADAARISRDGTLPLATGGGQLSAGRLHGHGLLYEACLQLRGEGGDRQIPRRPEVALVSAGGGPAAACLLLTRDHG